MKKVISLCLAVLTAAMCFAGCGKTQESDSAYVKNNGKLIVGITEFEPMDYQQDGKWVGFDADMATAFAESLGVKAEFVEIDWDNKTMELDGKTIDCVWNGMTLTEDVLSAMSCSKVSREWPRRCWCGRWPRPCSWSSSGCSSPRT